LPPVKIHAITITNAATPKELSDKSDFFFGKVDLSKVSLYIYYQNNKQECVIENKIDCEGGEWFTMPEAAQSECNRRNAEVRRIHNEQKNI